MSNQQETVLIVEDDEGISYLQCRVLERKGYRAVAVSTEKEALQLLACEHIDLVILDYRLSSTRTGLHLYADMKAAGHSVPVIIVTGFSDEMTVIRALRAGVRDFVSKSNDYLAYIPEAVDRVLAQTRLERRLEDVEARFQSFLNNLPAVAYIKDHRGQIVYANTRFELLFPQVDWHGKTEQEVFASSGPVGGTPPEIADRLREIVSRFESNTRWTTHTFPVAGTLGVQMCGVLAYEPTRG